MQSMVHISSFGPKIWWLNVFPVSTWRISWRVFWIKVQVVMLIWCKIFQIETNVESPKGEKYLFERTTLLILSSKLLVDSPKPNENHVARSHKRAMFHMSQQFLFSPPLKWVVPFVLYFRQSKSLITFHLLSWTFQTWFCVVYCKGFWATK